MVICNSTSALSQQLVLVYMCLSEERSVIEISAEMYVMNLIYAVLHYETVLYAIILK